MKPSVFRQVDAFTSTRYRGNPAGVCIYEGNTGPDEIEMQAIAAEMNLSETAFLMPAENGGYSIRFFTPTAEVDLCGHATLASAHVLYELGLKSKDSTLSLSSKSGPLSACLDGDWIELDFPLIGYTPLETSDEELKIVAGCLGLETPESILQPLYRGGVSRLLVELKDQASVAECAPDFRLMVESGNGAISVTARADDADCDFVSRFFAPVVGIDEDPVTGSAHCTLTPFWADRLGKSHLVGHQISRRRGVIRVAMAGERVKIAGQAVSVFGLELLSGDGR